MQKRSDKPAVRPWLTVSRGVKIAWWTGILLLGGGITALSISLAGDPAALSSWLQQAKLPLFFWRLALYSIVTGPWFHRVRAALLRQASSSGAVYRLEAMIISLMLLIEFTCYRWGM